MSETSRAAGKIRCHHFGSGVVHAAYGAYLQQQRQSRRGPDSCGHHTKVYREPVFDGSEICG
jgi:hypothetical protein